MTEETKDKKCSDQQIQLQDLKQTVHEDLSTLEELSSDDMPQELVKATGGALTIQEIGIQMQVSSQPADTGLSAQSAESIVSSCTHQVLASLNMEEDR